jgi:putative tricarboxylic transport membrane protein
MFAFAALGYFIRKTGYSLVCLFIGFLLGPLLEHSLRQTIILYDSIFVLFTRPFALPFTLLTLFFVWRFGIYHPARRRKERATGTGAAG